MKMITAFIQPFMLTKLTRALEAIDDFPGVTVTDTTIVDVVLIDTLMLVTRPHPDPNRSVVDTGYFTDTVLVMWTTITTGRFGKPGLPRKQLFQYFVRQ